MALLKHQSFFDNPRKTWFPHSWPFICIRIALLLYNRILIYSDENEIDWHKCDEPSWSVVRHLGPFRRFLALFLRAVLKATFTGDRTWKKSIPYFGTGTRFPSEMCLGEWQERDESIKNLTEQISYRNTCLSGSKLKQLLVWLICHMYVQINPWGAAVIVKSKNRLSFVSTCREGYEVFNVFDIWSPSCARWSLVCFNARKCHTENPRFYMCIDMFHRVICTSTMVDFVPLESQEPPVEIILHVWKRREQKKQARALFYS